MKGTVTNNNKTRSFSRAHLTISYSFCVICCKVQEVGIVSSIQTCQKMSSSLVTMMGTDEVDNMIADAYGVPIFQFFKENPLYFNEEFLTSIAHVVKGKNTRVTVTPGLDEDPMEDGSDEDLQEGDVATDNRTSGCIEEQNAEMTIPVKSANEKQTRTADDLYETKIAMDTSSNHSNGLPSCDGSPIATAVLLVQNTSPYVEIPLDREFVPPANSIFLSSRPNALSSNTNNDIGIYGNSICFGDHGKLGMNALYRARRNFLLNTHKRGKQREQLTKDFDNDWIQTHIIKYMIEHYQLHELHYYNKDLNEITNTDEIYEAFKKDLMKCKGKSTKGQDSQRPTKLLKVSETECLSSNAMVVYDNQPRSISEFDHVKGSINDILQKYRDISAFASCTTPNVNPALLSIFKSILDCTTLLLVKDELNDPETRTCASIFIEHVWCICTSLYAKDVPNSFKFTVRCTYDNESFVLDAIPSKTIADVKADIYKNHNVASECQILAFQGFVLQDSNSLSSYEIKQDSIVDLLLLNRAGGENAVLTGQRHQNGKGDAHKAISPHERNELSNPHTITYVMKEDDGDLVWDDQDDVSVESLESEKEDSEDDDKDEARNAKVLRATATCDRILHKFRAKFNAVNDEIRNTAEHEITSVDNYDATSVSNFRSSYMSDSSISESAAMSINEDDEKAKTVLANDKKFHASLMGFWDPPVEKIPSKRRYVGKVDTSNCDETTVRTAKTVLLNMDDETVAEGHAIEIYADGDELNAFHNACAEGRLDSVYHLLMDVHIYVDAQNNDGQTALHFACFGGHIDVAHFLLEYGSANVTIQDKEGCSALHDASSEGHLEIVKLLLAACPGNMDSKNSHGQTALYCACCRGHLEVARFLIETGKANTRITSLDMWGALHFASFHGNLEIVQYLVLDGNVNVNMRSNDGRTALHCASSKGHFDIVRCLVHNCRVNAELQDDDGWTALHDASSEGYLDIVQFLVQTCHVNVHTVNANGQTAYDLAQDFHHDNVVAFFNDAVESTILNDDDDDIASFEVETEEMIETA